MNYENEITVKVNTTYDKLHDILLKNNFIYGFYKQIYV